MELADQLGPAETPTEADVQDATPDQAQARTASQAASRAEPAASGEPSIAGLIDTAPLPTPEGASPSGAASAPELAPIDARPQAATAEPSRPRSPEPQRVASPRPTGPAPMRPPHRPREIATDAEAGTAELGVERGATAPQLRRFIKSRAYVPMHELRRRFAINGGDDDVIPIDVDRQRVYVGLPPREGSLLGELLRAGDIGYELSMDPIAPIVVGVYPMRPVPRS